MYEAAKDVLAMTTCFVLGAGLTSVLFVMYFIPKRDEFKSQLDKAELEKAKALLEVERAKRHTALQEQITTINQDTQKDLAADPVDVFNQEVKK